MDSEAGRAPRDLVTTMPDLASSSRPVNSELDGKFRSINYLPHPVTPIYDMEAIPSYNRHIKGHNELDFQWQNYQPCSQLWSQRQSSPPTDAEKALLNKLCSVPLTSTHGFSHALLHPNSSEEK